MRATAPTTRTSRRLRGDPARRLTPETIPGPGSPGGWSDRRPAPLPRTRSLEGAAPGSRRRPACRSAVSAEVDQDDLRLAGLPRTDRLVDHRPDGVVRLRGRHDPLRSSELYARVEHLVLRVRPGLHVPVLHQHGERGRVAVVA